MVTTHTKKMADCQPTSITSDQNLDGKLVLLAEDCMDQGRLYLTFLQSSGAEVVLECNGKSTIDLVKTSPRDFDAIVMDFQMPEMDGLESTRRLRELGFSGAIIAAAAFPSEELKQGWFQAGCDEFLEKPLRKYELINAVVSHVATETNSVGDP